MPIRQRNRHSTPHIVFLIKSLCCLCFILSHSAFAEKAPVTSLTIGYAPVLSRQILESRSAPLIKYFKQHHQVDLRLKHSTNFDTYLENALHKKFDLTISQINYAEAFQSQLGYLPLLRSSKQFHVLVLKRKDDDSINSLQQLKHKSIGVPEGLSFISALFAKALESHGIDPSMEVDLIKFNRHDQLFLSLLRSKVDAAITVEITLKMASSFENKLSVLHEIPAGPAVFSASPNLNKSQKAWLLGVLQKFSASSEGHTYLASLAFEKLIRMNEKELTSYHPYAIPLHQKLENLSNKVTNND